MKKTSAHPHGMGLRTWWLDNKLRRTENKLKALRARQRQLRDQESDLAKARRGGLSAQEAEARERKLHAEKERITHEIGRLLGDEERLKRELREAGATLATH